MVDNKEQAKVIGWTCALLIIVVVWSIYDVLTMGVDYHKYNYPIDSRTGQPVRPRDVYDLNKILNQTEKYIESTNAIERLYDLTYTMNHQSPFPIDQSYTNPQQLALSGWPAANQSTCGHQLQWILAHLNRTGPGLALLGGREARELMQLVDSFGKPEAGLHLGLVTWLGSYESCQRVKLNHSTIETRYCFARMRPVWWPKNESVATSSIIRIGSCLPESCDTNSFHQHKGQLEELIEFDLPDFWRQGLQLESLFCLPDERSPIRRIPQSGWIFMCLVAAWLVVVLTGTIAYERIRSKKERSYPSASMAPMDRIQQQMAPAKWRASSSSVAAQLAQALSIRCSFKAFKTSRFRVRYHQGERVRVDLSVLDLFRCLMCLGVVLGHSGYLWLLYARTMAHKIAKSTSVTAHLSLSMSRIVDTYFLFFGVLAGYTILRKFSARQLASPATWLLVNAGIFLRITPLFMLLFWYNKSVSPYTSSGPWWDYGVDRHSQRGVCMDDPWWRSLPYFGYSNNLPASLCNPPGWFIISYSHICLLLPLTSFVICRLPSHGWRLLLVALLSLISVGQLAIKIVLQTSVEIEQSPAMGVLVVGKFEPLGFISTLTKFGTVVVGCFAGYLLKEYESGNITEWPRWLTSKLTFVATILLHILVVLLPVMGYYLAHLTQRYTITLTEFIVSTSALMLLWPILNTIVLINCTTIYNSYSVIRFAGHPFWRVFNKLGLCLFLIHWEVLLVGLTSFEQGPSHGFVMDIMKLWAFGVFFSLTFALVLHILFEAPLAALTTLLFSRLLSGDGGNSGQSTDVPRPPPAPLPNIELLPKEQFGHHHRAQSTSPTRRRSE